MDKQYKTFSEFIKHLKSQKNSFENFKELNQENFNDLIKYNEYLAETLNKSIDYSEYLAEALNNISVYLNMQHNNSYSDFCKYTNEGKSLDDIKILLRKNKIDKLLNE